MQKAPPHLLAQAREYLDSLIEKSKQACAEIECPDYGVTGPRERSHSSSSTEKEKRDQNSHETNKSHQATLKQSSPQKRPRQTSAEFKEEEFYAVYECPGLASTCEMEVTNPLFEEATSESCSKKTSGSAGN